MLIHNFLPTIKIQSFQQTFKLDLKKMEKEKSFFKVKVKIPSKCKALLGAYWLGRLRVYPSTRWVSGR